MNIKETNRFLSACFLLLLSACVEERREEEEQQQQFRITVTCAAATLDVTKSTQCSANVTDLDGRPADVGSLSWSSSDGELAGVDLTGRVTARARGTVTIRATAFSTRYDVLPGEATLNVQGLLHSGLITAPETWRAADNPHVVRSYLTVDGANAPQLTLEAGVVVRFLSGAQLEVGGMETGVLSVEGTEASPVLLTSDDPDNASESLFWAGLLVREHSSIRLHHAVIEGVDGHWLGGALYVNGSLLADNVTVRRCIGGAAYLRHGGTFAPGSTKLRVNGCGYPLLIWADVVGSIPSDSEFTDNESNAVFVSGDVEHSQTWPNLGVPYVIQENLLVGDPDSRPVLTLVPGTEIRMARDQNIWVHEQGSLVAQGTATRPIRFVANASTPSPGFWKGLIFGDARGSRLDHVSVSHAGPAALTVLQELGAFVTRSEFTHSSGCGLLRAPEVTTDFTRVEYGNTFLDNALEAQCTLENDPSAPTRVSDDS
ncbi:Ig-like domain-containing protein [Cystobacter fuscus]|uniref:Ig-like domain-containing protein n=1 Tax=Cystobacter fuscus TaxID=43 RepID=UPI002B2D5468|nr:Ig-like domain-containing protein [Cystobacter fuscus]